MCADPIDFDVTIHIDSMSMLFNKPDIRKELVAQLQQGDIVLELVSEDLNDAAYNAFDMDSEEVADVFASNVCDKFSSMDVEELMNFISYREEDIEFDYSEADACDDRRLAAFRIYCLFDTEKFLDEVTKEEKK